MSMVANIHRVTKVKANSAGPETHWVEFEDEAKNNRVVIFCPNAEVARATADAFNDAMGYSQAEVNHEPA